jgi:tRNA G18 (ribose-2'-O)-methylase SpoU/glycosyltransferase involved in cell wall biosynthesis
MKIRFFVMGFASHKRWAEGYQRASAKHDIHIEVVSGDRWKYRMMAACAEWESKIAEDDDVLVIDGMFDITILVALLKSRIKPPRVLVYLHENQLTTPFTSQDRDKKNNTHWHYGMAHWRSLLVADGFVFNSQTHLEAFAKALPKVINEQCPRDAVQWHLKRAQELLGTKCTILRHGLDLDELLQSKKRPHGTLLEEDASTIATSSKKIPTVLWNARLEEDKAPAAFLDLMHQVRRRKDKDLDFRLIILGIDPSKEKKWEMRIRKEFAKELLYLGWCEDRKEYAQWLQKASIVISTAQHETFGISIVESVFCGALPLLPKRLSYPELFPPDQFGEDNLYSTTRGDGLDKLLRLLSLVANDPRGHAKAQARSKAAVTRFRWALMGSVYDHFFSDIATGNPITLAGNKAATMYQDALFVEPPSTAMVVDATSTEKDSPIRPQVIVDVTDKRVALFRPKSLRNYEEYNQQMTDLQAKGVDVAIHGGRRTTIRMLEAISMGARIRPISFLTTKELAKNVLVGPMQQQQRLNDIPLYVADNKDLLDEIRGQKLNSGDAILCMVQFPIVSELDELIADPPIMIFDDVRNAQNLGSILRTAFCLGIKSIVASSTTWSALKDSRSARCSMGTMYHQKFYKSCDLLSTIRHIQMGGVKVYGVEIGPNSIPVQPHGSNKNWAAVMGNEDVGLNQEIASECDNVVFVPQAHGDSLNVGHAAAITMFELGRDCPAPKHDGRAACS